MTLALDFPQCCRSPLGRLDPRWKLAALVPAAIAAALLNSWAAAALAASGALTLAALAQLPPRWYLVRLGWVSLVLALFLAWPPFLPLPGEATWDLGWLTISPAGLSFAGLLLVKALTVVSLALAVLATATLQDLCKAAHALRVPGVLVQLFLLTYRFIFLLADEFARLRIALRVRGFRNRGNWHSYRTIGQVAGTLLVRGHERSERVGQAMRCRGHDGQFRSLRRFRTGAADVVFWVLVVGISAALVAWDFLGR